MLKSHKSENFERESCMCKWTLNVGMSHLASVNQV